MHRFRLELLLHIIGIGSASGLFYRDNVLYLVGDNAAFLYQYDISAKSLDRYPLIAGDTLENIAKKHKPDFEALAFDEEHFYIFGSGSTQKRNSMVRFSRYANTVTATFDLSPLYDVMRSFAGISNSDFNIEGVVKNGETWYFFQRGNGLGAQNGIFTVTGDLTGEFSMLYNPFTLDSVRGIGSGFTDAVLSGETLYFLAATEDSQSTYLDGEVLGSFIGAIDISTMRIIKTQKINAMHKFEGLAIYSESADEISFVLCEDNDSDHLKSDIFKLTIPKQRDVENK